MDIVYGAFHLHDPADQRVAYREGGFDTSVAFYPAQRLRSAAAWFLHLVSGGILASPMLCRRAFRESCRPKIRRIVVCHACQAVVTIPLAVADDSALGLACTVNDASGMTFYREPPATAPTPLPT